MWLLSSKSEAVILYFKCILLDHSSLILFTMNHVILFIISYIFIHVKSCIMLWRESSVHPIIVPLLAVFFISQLIFHHFKGILCNLMGSIITLTGSVCCWYFMLLHFYTRVMYGAKKGSVFTKAHTGFPCAQDKIHTCELPCTQV